MLASLQQWYDYFIQQKFLIIKMFSASKITCVRVSELPHCENWCYSQCSQVQNKHLAAFSSWKKKIIIGWTFMNKKWWSNICKVKYYTSWGYTKNDSFKKTLQHRVERRKGQKARTQITSLFLTHSMKQNSEGKVTRLNLGEMS